MELKGKYKLSYTLDREPMDMVLDIELTMNEGSHIPGCNIWSGHATFNGVPYTKEDLTHCVDAKLAVERIGHKLRDDVKELAKKEGKSFRLKKEEVK